MFAAYYDTGVWVPIGLVLVVAAALAFVVRPPRVNLALAMTLAGLAGLVEADQRPLRSRTAVVDRNTTSTGDMGKPRC